LDWQHTVVTDNRSRVATDTERVTVVDVRSAVRRDTGMEQGVTVVTPTHLKELVKHLLKVHTVTRDNLVATDHGKTVTVVVIPRTCTQMLDVCCCALRHECQNTHLVYLFLLNVYCMKL
jgi:hypothetical protein